METTRAKRGVHPLGIGVGWLLMGATLWAQDTNSPLEIFQRFVNGKVPVKDAVVYRKLTKLDGTLMNEEWMRFGYQDGSCFIFRLARDTNNPAQLIPLDRHTVCGASFNQLWTIGDKNLHVADKLSASGSVPETFGAFPRNFMLGSLALGIPRLEIQDIQWAGSNFTTKVASHRDARGVPTETATLNGRLLLGADGLPAAAEYSGVGDFPDAVVNYEYGLTTKGIPVVFTVRVKEPNGSIFRYEFLSLTLGKDNLEETDGYVPMMFGDARLLRTAALWTDGQSRFVDQLDLRLPAVAMLRTNSLAFTLPSQTTSPIATRSIPKKTGWLIIVAASAAAIIAVLLVRHRRSKSENGANLE